MFSSSEGVTVFFCQLCNSPHQYSSKLDLAHHLLGCAKSFIDDNTATTTTRTSEKISSGPEEQLSPKIDQEVIEGGISFEDNSSTFAAIKSPTNLYRNNHHHTSAGRRRRIAEEANRRLESENPSASSSREASSSIVQHSQQSQQQQQQVRTAAASLQSITNSENRKETEDGNFILGPWSEKHEQIEKYTCSPSLHSSLSSTRDRARRGEKVGYCEVLRDNEEEEQDQEDEKCHYYDHILQSPQEFNQRTEDQEQSASPSPRIDEAMISRSLFHHHHNTPFDVFGNSKNSKNKVLLSTKQLIGNNNNRTPVLRSSGDQKQQTTSIPTKTSSIFNRRNTTTAINNNNSTTKPNTCRTPVSTSQKSSLDTFFQRIASSTSSNSNHLSSSSTNTTSRKPKHERLMMSGLSSAVSSSSTMRPKTSQTATSSSRFLNNTSPGISSRVGRTNVSVINTTSGTSQKKTPVISRTTVATTKR